MMNTIAYEIDLWAFSIDLGTGPVGAVLSVVILMAVLIASIDGMTIAFRGIRDSITAYRKNGGTPNPVTRFVSTIVVLFLFLTGGAFIIGLAAWLCGSTSLFRRKAKPVTHKEVAKTEEPSSV